jgi:hypothetical protein
MNSAISLQSHHTQFFTPLFPMNGWRPERHVPYVRLSRFDLFRVMLTHVWYD